MTGTTQQALNAQISVHISNAHPRLPYKATLILFVFSLSFLFISCTHNPVGPGDILTPGRRDYVWTVDTINVPNTTLGRLAGFSPESIWISGWGGMLGQNIVQVVNDKWKLRSDINMTSIISTASFPPNEIWFGGKEGMMYQMINDQVVFQKKIEISNSYFYPSSINKNSSGEVLFVGSTLTNSGPNEKFLGECYKLNNRIITKKTFNQEIVSSAFLKFVFSQHDTLLLSVSYFDGGIDSIYLYRTYNGEITLLGKNIVGSEENLSASMIGDKLLFIKGKNIYQINNNEIIEELYCNDFYPSWLSGRHLKDFFIITNSTISHYNGTDVSFCYKIQGSNPVILDTLIFDKDVYFICFDFGSHKNLFIHGKLQ